MTPNDPRHGTDRGYGAHIRSRVPACGACRHAHAVANKRRGLADAPTRKVPALGSQRRVQALQAIGWSRDRIARELGYSEAGSIAYLMRAETMLPATAARIAVVYDRLSMVVPVGQGAERARTWARRQGFWPPLAWDDVDDPDEVPDVGRDVLRHDEVDQVVVDRFLSGEWGIATTKPERVEITARWLAWGRSLKALEQATGWRAERYVTRQDGAA